MSAGVLGACLIHNLGFHSLQANGMHRKVACVSTMPHVSRLNENPWLCLFLPWHRVHCRLLLLKLCTQSTMFRCTHILFLSVSIKKSWHHEQCQQSLHTFWWDKIACCDLGMLPLLNSFNGLFKLFVYSQALLTYYLSCLALELKAAPPRVATALHLTDTPLALLLWHILCWIKLLPC